VRTEPENATVTSSYATPFQTSTETRKGRTAVERSYPKAQFDIYMYTVLICKQCT